LLPTNVPFLKKGMVAMQPQGSTRQLEPPNLERIPPFRAAKIGGSNAVAAGVPQVHKTSISSQISLASNAMQPLK
jgi:hypothetical protein